MEGGAGGGGRMRRCTGGREHVGGQCGGVGGGRCWQQQHLRL